MVIKSNKKNPINKICLQKNINQRLLSPKKVREVLEERKINF